MNHFRNRAPDHPAALRNNPKRGGSVATQKGSDSGSVDAELTDAAEDMQSFAQRDRKARLPAIKKRDAQVKRQRDYFRDRE
jgi:hypothetical protein